MEDVPLLASLNQMLIEDEKAETDLTMTQLEERMADFLQTSYAAFLFYDACGPLGYALCDRQQTPVYLRQFFICRDKRRKGYGRQALQLLRAHLDIRELEIDVYGWNRQGLAFWKAVGFEERFCRMRYKE